MTPIPGPIILLAVPLLAAGIAYLVRRWALLAALISALATASLAHLCLRLPLNQSAFVFGQEVAFGRPVAILGRSLALEPAGQMWLAFVFALATILYLFAWRMSQGRSFYSFSLVILSLYALMVLLQTFSLAVIVFAISATIAVFIIQGGIGSSIRGGQRYLIVALLAVPFLLTAAWLVDLSTLSPENADMLRSALLPAALGFALLLAVFPFGTWIPALAADAPPIVTAFILAAGQAMAVFLALAFLQGTPLSLEEPAVAEMVLLAGLVMAVSGGAMAAAQRDFGRLFGYAALSNLGILLLALPGSGRQGLELALLHGISGALSIILLAMSLSILRHRATTDEFAGIQGTARKLPIAALGLMLGALSLAGFPVTAGFPTHWAISRYIWNWAWPASALAQATSLGTDVIQIEQWMWILAFLAIIVSSAGIAIGTLRGLSAMLGDKPRPEMARDPVVASLMVAAMATLVVILGLYPDLFIEPVQRAAQAISLF